MSRILTIVSEHSKSGNTTIAFNLAYLLKQEDKKVLLVSLNHMQSDFQFLEPKINSNNLILHQFVIFSIHKNVQMLLLKNSYENITNFNDIFVNQINKVKKYFDFIILFGSHEVLDKVNIALRESHEVIGICDANNISTNSITNILHNIRLVQESNSDLKIFIIVLNMFDINNHSHLEWMLQIKKSFGQFYTFITLPYHKSLLSLNKESINFVKNSPWEDYAISLNKVVDALLKRK